MTKPKPIDLRFEHGKKADHVIGAAALLARRSGLNINLWPSAAGWRVSEFRTPPLRDVPWRAQFHPDGTFSLEERDGRPSRGAILKACRRTLLVDHRLQMEGTELLRGAGFEV